MGVQIVDSSLRVFLGLAEGARHLLRLAQLCCCRRGRQFRVLSVLGV
jgi:hypothetical protein